MEYEWLGLVNNSLQVGDLSTSTEVRDARIIPMVYVQLGTRRGAGVGRRAGAGRGCDAGGGRRAGAECVKVSIGATVGVVIGVSAGWVV